VRLHNRDKYRNDKDRILQNIKIDKKTKCWVWQLQKDKEGYGRLKYKKSTLRAHRGSYLLFNGEIPEGLLVCHSCDNPSCVNPEHLWLGSPKENTQDMLSKGRGRLNRQNGELNCSSKLTDRQAVELVKLVDGGMTQTEAAKRYKVTNALVSCIMLEKCRKGTLCKARS